MPLSQSLKDTVNPKLDNLVTQLSTIQSTYKDTVGAYLHNPDRAYGKYWQGSACTATVPADGNTVAVTMTAKPTDQAENWTNVGVTLDANLPVQLRVDAYVGPQGHGYVVAGRVIEAGVTYERAVNVGPETYRQHDWA